MSILECIDYGLNDVPKFLWDEWKETVPRRLTLEEGIFLLLIEKTLSERDLPDEKEAKIKEVKRDIIDG